MAIQHHPRHVGSGGNNLTVWCPQRTLEITVIESWVLSKYKKLTIYIKLIRPGAYSISGTELYPVALLPTAVTDVRGRWRVSLQASYTSTFERGHTHIPGWH